MDYFDSVKKYFTYNEEEDKDIIDEEIKENISSEKGKKSFIKYRRRK